MDRNLKIYIAGHTGMAGSAIVRLLGESGYRNLVFKSHEELELLNQRNTEEFLNKESPDIVILAAAKVGGINANTTYPVEFLLDNLMIQNNVMRGAYIAGVKKLIFLGSSCIYPRDCLQPIKEQYLLSGVLERTNRPYAIAKISGIELCWAYNRQYGTRYIGLMPTNLYGFGDNYNLDTSHVVPALIRKVHEAVATDQDTVTAWGSGKPLREFLFADDFANAVVCILQLLNQEKFQIFSNDEPPIINIGSGEEVTIADLLGVICETVGFQGEVIWDQKKPDGTPQKFLDNSRITSLGWLPKVPLREGIRLAYQDYLANIETRTSN